MKLEEGKWYKWYQKNHDGTHTGKYFNCPDEGFVKMKPWIVRSIQYDKEGTFDSKFMQDIVEITDLTEISKLLPDGHEDKVKPASAILGAEATKGFLLPKSERYLATMKFFNQLREPERSQAIANYTENYDNHVIPDDLFIALQYGFSWEDSNEGHSYWENVCSDIEDNTYFKESEPIKEAVHCPTQEEFDYVTEKLGYEWRLIHPFDIYTTDSCIEIGFKCCGRKDDFEGYIILSFQEWCTENNHEGLKPWVAQAGDWIVLLESIQGFEVGKPYPVTDISGDRLWAIQGMNCQIDRKYYRKATQAEIDSVTNPTEALGLPITKDVVWTQWTHDNWYVEVSSQEEADMVIKAADKMYGKTSKSKYIKYTEDWKYVNWYNGNSFCPLDTNHLSKSAIPRPISDFIPTTSNIVSTAVSNGSILIGHADATWRHQEDTVKNAAYADYRIPYTSTTTTGTFITQYPLTPSESFKVKSNPKLLDSNVSKISSINISLKQKSKTKKL